MGARTHSFDAERELMRALAQAGYLTFCEYRSGRRRDNRACGLRAKSFESPETFDELDGVLKPTNKTKRKTTRQNAESNQNEQ